MSDICWTYPGVGDLPKQERAFRRLSRERAAVLQRMQSVAPALHSGKDAGAPAAPFSGARLLRATYSSGRLTMDEIVPYSSMCLTMCWTRIWT